MTVPAADGFRNDDDRITFLLEQFGPALATLDFRDERVPGNKPNDKRWYIAQARKRLFVIQMGRSLSLAESLKHVGWSQRIYYEHRKNDKRFAAEVDAARGTSTGRPKQNYTVDEVKNLLAKVRTEGAQPSKMQLSPRAKGLEGWVGFAGFRKAFFDHDTPWFHQKIVDTLESSDPGSVTLVLLPPEHGKTSLLEDWIGYKLATNPDFRVIYGSEKIAHSRKVIKRIKWRMDPDGPTPDYVRSFGPFVPQKGDLAHAQPWNADYFDVYRRSDSDERDYSMVGLGFTAAVAGSRCDLLVMDDGQSLKSLGQTKKMLEEFRQDWLSRPGAKGRTVILGTRVGPGDFYEALEAEGLLDHVVKIPAIDHQGRYLWPERYTPEDYQQMERKVGPVAWARNFMQNPQAAGDRTFTDEMLQAAANPAFRFGKVPENVEMRVAIVGHDPGYGTNAVATVGVTPEAMWVLGWRADLGLTSNHQMAQVICEEIDHFAGQGLRTAHVVVEKSFGSQGLFTDDSFIDITRKYGCSIAPHHTGFSKLDDNIGVAAMARSFSMGEIILPGADDPDTQRARAALDSEFAAWRPGVKGTKLRQDILMAVWMCWVRWRTERLNTATDDRTHVIRTSGIPNPTRYRPLVKIGA